MTGAVVVGPVLGVWDHDLPAVAAAGALTVLAAATVAAAIQAWWGPIGTGIVILLLVVIGNPGSGGIYAPEFLPEWLRGMHRWNASGLSTNLIKSVVYFDRRAAVWPAAVLTVWTLLGVLSATIYHARRRASRAARRSATPPTSAHASPAG